MHTIFHLVSRLGSKQDKFKIRVQQLFRRARKDDDANEFRNCYKCSKAREGLTTSKTVHIHYYNI